MKAKTHLADFLVDLSKQWRYLRRVIGMLIGANLRDNHASVGIDCQMQFAPGAALH